MASMKLSTPSAVTFKWHSNTIVSTPPERSYKRSQDNLSLKVKDVLIGQIEMLTSFTDSLFSSFAHISSSASLCPLAFIPQLLHLCWSTLRLSAPPLGSCSKPPHQQCWPSWNLWPFLPPQSPNPPAWMLCFSGLHEITLLHSCSSASFLASFQHTPKWILLHFCRV